jgi:hypothetical protein
MIGLPPIFRGTPPQNVLPCGRRAGLKSRTAAAEGSYPPRPRRMGSAPARLVHAAGEAGHRHWYDAATRRFESAHMQGRCMSVCGLRDCCVATDSRSVSPPLPTTTPGSRYRIITRSRPQQRSIPGLLQPVVVRPTNPMVSLGRCWSFKPQRSVADTTINEHPS